MTSGVQFNENYTDPYSDVGKLDVACGWKPVPPESDPNFRWPRHMFELVLSLETLERRHGDWFAYRSIETDVLAFCMERATGKRLPQIVADEIWAPMGAEENACFTVDAAGYALADGGFNACLRDYGRLGLLYLEHGAGVMPPSWVEATRSANHAIFGEPYTYSLPHGGYRNQWWVEDPQSRAIMARGVFGQMIYVNWDYNMVVVKLSSWPDFLNVPYNVATLRPATRSARRWREGCFQRIESREKIMSDTDLCYMPAAEALRLFRKKKLSPVELMEATIRRAEATRDKINCFTYTHFDEAMDLARKAEARYAKGKARGALEGLPIGIKDESFIKGKPTSGGSLIYKDYVGEHTSPMNERILKEGGIVHARTATPEFSCAAYTWSRLWGVTRNPWNPKFTPGGSSGGTAASLASGNVIHRNGFGHRWLDPHPGLDLRACRLQAALWPQPGRSAVQSRLLLPYRTARADRGRRDPAAERDGGAAPARYLDAEAQAHAAHVLSSHQGLEDRILDGPRLLSRRPAGAEEYAGRSRCVPVAGRRGA